MYRSITAAALACTATIAAAQSRPAQPAYRGQAQGAWAGNGQAADDAQDDGYGDGYGGYGYGYGADAPAYRPQAPYQGGQPGMPSYQDDGRYGAGYGYDSTDARGAAQGAVPPAPPARATSNADYRRQQQQYRAQLDEYHRRLRAYHGTYGNYSDRAAALRARADACERGDDAACG